VRRFEDAISADRDAAAIYRETGDRYGEGQTLDNLGIAYQEMRQPGRAAACWREAAAAMRDTGDHAEAVPLEQLAVNAQAGQRP
jgi:tetratricopeptide (TPR) repeat protein